MDKYIRYTDFAGNQLAVLTAWSKLEYGRVKNDVGVLDLELPADLLSGMPIVDGRLEVYRRVGASAYYLDGETQWLIRRFTYGGDEIRPTVRIQAYDLNTVLTRRCIEYYADTPYTSKTNQIDDMMKDIIKENFGASAVVAARNISAYLQVQPDLTLAPSISKAFSWRQVLPLLQELAEISLQNGTWLAFDIVKVSDTVSEFRTYAGQRGVDLSSTVFASQSNGSIAEATLTYDFAAEITEVHATGRGEGVDRATVSVTDAVRAARSPINRIERVEQSAQTDLATTLQSEAEEALRAGRPKIILEGRIVDSDALQFGVHYNYGDVITVQHMGVAIPCHIDMYSISDTAEGENLTVNFRGEISA